MCGALGAEVPGHRQQQLTQTLIVRLKKTHFLHRSLILKSQQNRIELVTRPAPLQAAAAVAAHAQQQADMNALLTAQVLKLSSPNFATVFRCWNIFGY